MPLPRPSISSSSRRRATTSPGSTSAWASAASPRPGLPTHPRRTPRGPTLPPTDAIDRLGGGRDQPGHVVARLRLHVARLPEAVLGGERRQAAAGPRRAQPGHAMRLALLEAVDEVGA